MGDVSTLAVVEKVSGAQAAQVKQSILDAQDVSMYDGGIDYEITCHSVDHANGFKVTIITSMQNKSDDDSWLSVATSTTLTAGVTFTSLSVPARGGTNPLLRYIRYRIDFQTSASSCVVSITGIARRNT